MTFGLAGVTAMDTSVAAVTVKVTAGDTIPVVGSVAVMALVPTPSPVASPFVGVALLMLAVAGVPEPQVTVVVMTWVVPSV
jgi:hypothetical protein